MKRLIPLIVVLCLLPLSMAQADAVEGATQIENVEQLVALHKEGVPFVDVRSARSYKRGHIPGAVHLDVGSEDFNKEALAAVAGKDEKVVFYCNCTSGCNYAPTASKMAASWGYTNIFYSTGGAIDWRYRAGLELESSK